VKLGNNALAEWFLLFGIKVSALYILFLFAFKLIAAFNGFHWIELAEAKIVYNIINFFYSGIELHGRVLSNLMVAGKNSGFAISIDDACVGFFPIAAFSAIVLALPVAAAKRMKCLAVGLPILFAANLARLVMVLFAAAFYGLEGFDFFHLTVVKYDLMVLVIVVFLLCVNFVIGKKELMETVRAQKEEQKNNAQQ